MRRCRRAQRRSPRASRACAERAVAHDHVERLIGVADVEVVGVDAGDGTGARAIDETVSPLEIIRSCATTAPRCTRRIVRIDRHDVHHQRTGAKSSSGRSARRTPGATNALVDHCGHHQRKRRRRRDHGGTRSSRVTAQRAAKRSRCGRERRRSTCGRGSRDDRAERRGAIDEERVGDVAFGARNPTARCAR
jgi:hypothetical protein